MNIGLLSIMHNKVWDFRADMAQTYANALKNAVSLHISNGDIDKQRGFFLSAKRGFTDKLYVGNIHYIENHLYWNDEELADDDQIINVMVIDGPVTRDGGACSYGSKDQRDQILYANTIPQVVGHLFLINTPGGEAAARIDYEQAIADCREKGKPTVAFVDGMCCSAGVNLSSRCDRTIVMNGKDDFGCIGSMAAFWATPDGTTDRDGSRWVEIVGDDSPEKNAWWREAAQGEYEKLREMINKSTKEFHQSVRENRPLVEDWMLTGEVFEAGSVIPALVDEIGDYNRAIECVFLLADKSIPAAREAVRVETPATDDTTGDEIPTNKDINNIPKNFNDMRNEETKVEETVAVETPQTTETSVQEPTQAVDEKISENEPTDVTLQVTADEAGKEPEEEPAAEPEDEAGEPEKEPEEEQEKEPEEPEKEPEEESEKEPEESEAEPEEEPEKEPEEESGETVASDAQSEIAKITEALHTAETLIGERDKTITALNGTIEKLTKQIADLRAELKEFSEKPAPMVNASAGIPEGNGTGEAPKAKGSRVQRGMSYKEILAVTKER